MSNIAIFAFIFAFICVTFGEIQSTPEDNIYLISSVLYGDYDRECPKGMAVTDFQFKLLNSSSSEGNETSLIESIMNDGSHEERKQDVGLKGHCSRHIDNNALATALAENKINDSSAQCRFGEVFNVQDSVEETDYATMCKPGEYIGGASSTFNNTRLLKLKCCHAPGVLIHDRSFGCYNVNSDKDSIKSLVKHGSGCPVDVLTGVRITNGTNLIGRYCSLSIIGFDYTNSTCHKDRQNGILHQSSKATTYLAGSFTLMFFFTLIFARNILLD